MSTLINTELIKSFNPCEDRFDNWCKHYGELSVTPADFCKLTEITVPDMLWVLQRVLTRPEDKPLWVTFANGCVERAKQCAAANAANAANAAYASSATSAAYAAYAAAANAASAAYAASAAAYAAYASAYASSAAANAAYAASAAANAAEREKQRDHLIKLLTTPAN